MDFAGRTEINASREATWAFLMDPHKVGTCGPGVQSIEVIDADTYRMTVRVGIGVITSTFRLDANVRERNEPERAVIVVKGQAPGTAVEATAEMRLSEVEAAAAMDWTANVRLSGKIASLGERLIRGTAERMINQTFECIKSRLAAEGAATTEAGTTGARVEVP